MKSPGDKKQEMRKLYQAQVNRAWTMGEQNILDAYRTDPSWGWSRVEKMTIRLKAALDEIDKAGVE